MLLLSLSLPSLVEEGDSMVAPLVVFPSLHPRMPRSPPLQICCRTFPLLARFTIPRLPSRIARYLPSYVARL